MKENKRYRAFISYSQRDKSWAQKLHKALENYTVPLGVIADVDPKTRKLGRVFRDDEEMGASESLGRTLEGALDDSRTLIVLCSPHSAQSPWVDLEVRRFKRNKNARVFAVLIDGTPNSGDPETECFCPALRFKVTEAGDLTDTPDEPLAPSWKKDGLNKLKVRLSAGILGIKFDELWQRNKRRVAKQRAIGSVLAAFMMVLAAGYYVKVQSQITRLVPTNQYQEFLAWYYEIYLDARFEDSGSEQLSLEDFSESVQVVRRDDMNDDGYVDYFVMVEIQEFCGTAGCPENLFVRTENGYKEVYNQFNDEPIIINEWKTKGFRDFRTKLGEFNNGTPIFGLHRYNGSEYKLFDIAICPMDLVEYCDFSSEEIGFSRLEDRNEFFMPLDRLALDKQALIAERIDMSSTLYDNFDWAQKQLEEITDEGDLYIDMAVHSSGDYVLSERDWHSHIYLVRSLGSTE